MNIEQGLCICTLQGQKKVALFYDYNNTYLLFIYIWPRNRTVAKTPFNSKVQFGRMLFIRCMERNFPKLIFLVITWNPNLNLDSKRGTFQSSYLLH